MSKRSLLGRLGLATVAAVLVLAVACAGNDSDSVAPTMGVAASDGFGDEGRNLGSSEAAMDKGMAPSFAEGSPGSGPASQGGALVSSVDRKIISTASIQMQVEDVSGGFEEVGRIASAAGGFVANSSLSYRGEDQFASVTIRVPTDQYQSVLSSLRRLGVKVDAESSDANDVTEQYTDLASRLRTLEATEAQLLTLLARADTIGDILTVQDRLNYTRGEIEQVKGRMQLLDDLTDLATISVHLRPVVAGGGTSSGGLGDKASEAWDDSLRFLGDIAGAVVTVMVFAWWVPIVGVPVLLAYRVATRQRQQPKPATEISD